MDKIISKTPIAIILVLTIILLSGLISIAQRQTKKSTPQTESYTRPAPRKPQLPAIPKVNKYQDDKVFLEQADSLFRPYSMVEEKQVVKGNVKFRQGNMWMYCDSAYYYPERNALDAYGHVEMQQGDTLFVFADKLVYDGIERKAVLTNGPSRKNVTLKDPKVTLTTDSLDYDMASDIGWYAVGGKLEDGENTLTSIFGQYSPSTKIAEFRDDVLLVNPTDNYQITTDVLIYDTRTAEADLMSSTRIVCENDTIYTESGKYNTRTEYAELVTRSLILHRDSAGNVITLEGDSIIYDKQRRISEAFTYRDLQKISMPMVITDTARKVTLIGGYGYYNDSLQTAMSTQYPLMIEYSRPDSLLLRADTIIAFMRTSKVWPDSLSHNWDVKTRQRFSRINSVMELADMMPVKLPLIPSDMPLPGTDPMPLAAANRIKLPRNLADFIDIAGPAEEDNHASNDDSGKLEKSGNSQVLIKPRLDALGRDSAFMVDHNWHLARAIGKARFFNKDIQGIADTIVFVQLDSMLYLRQKPIVWSGERQIMGDTITVHFNNSQADWAHLPTGGVVSEHIDEDFFNQLSGAEMWAYFQDNELRHLYVNGSVEAILLPQENDSSYNKIVKAESSFLTLDMADRQLNKLKMWPEVDGTVTPLYLLQKKEEQFLQNFKWWDFLRPRREWYEGVLRWDDEMGEIPDALIKYFEE